MRCFEKRLEKKRGRGIEGHRRATQVPGCIDDRKETKCLY
jgi:hypothetical protein